MRGNEERDKGKEGKGWEWIREMRIKRCKLKDEEC